MRVTVIATGFTVEGTAVQPEVEEVDSPEIIKYPDWLRMKEGIIRKTPNEYLLERNSPGTDLGIPTILRDKNLAKQNEA